ncbi:glycosyltransferase family 4 protein [Georgenia sp.]
MQDLSYALLLERFGPGGVPHFRTLSRRRIEELHRRQERIFEGAAALLPMSSWLASSIERSGVDPTRIHVVNPGINMPLGDDDALPERRSGQAMRLLMVGRDFDTKGGAQVVGAFKLLRREMGPRIELTIAGPDHWPLRGDVPEGVRFLGTVAPKAVHDLMDSHDLFVMPSLFEGFGIVFAEALVRGLPCIGRDACAMPEIIDQSSGGRLVRSEDPGDLAALIVDALADDDLYLECARRATERLAHYSWDRAARDVAAVAAVAANRR